MMFYPNEISIFVPGRPSSPNATRRRHWSADSGAVKQRRRDVYLLATDALNRRPTRDGFPLGRCELDIWFVLTAARGDLDNLVAGSKAIIDGLVDAKVIATDSVACVVELRIRWRRGPAAGVDITVRERSA